MDPVFEALISKLRSRKEVGDLPSTQLSALTESLELLEKMSGSMDKYIEDVDHLKNKTDLYMKIAEHKRNRDLEIVLSTLAGHYFKWWPAS